MKRRDVVRHLHRHGCVLRREGSEHSIYVNPATNQEAAVPRHREISINTVRRICRDLGIPPP